MKIIKKRKTKQKQQQKKTVDKKIREMREKNSNQIGNNRRKLSSFSFSRLFSGFFCFISLMCFPVKTLTKAPQNKTHKEKEEKVKIIKKKH